MTKAEAILNECRRLGLTVTKVGKAWHIRGRNVDIVAAALECVDLVDLKR